MYIKTQENKCYTLMVACESQPSIYLKEISLRVLHYRNITTTLRKRRPFSASKSSEILTVVQNVVIKTQKVRNVAIKTVIHKSSRM